MVNARPLVFIDHASALGGAERSLLLLLKHLDRARWQPHLACTGGPLAEAAAAVGAITHAVPMPRLRRSPSSPLDGLRGSRIIARLARQVGASVLHANTVRAAFYAAPAALLASTPFVWHVRDFWLSESRPRCGWLDWLGKRVLCTTAARVVANSYATAGHLPCRRKAVVVHNALELERYDPQMDAAPFRERYGIPFHAPLVGTVGRLRPWKGQDRFLRVLSRVIEAVPGVRGLVVGGSPFGVQDDYPQHLRRLAHDLSLDEHVILTGHLQDVRSALAAIDVFVHPGDPEPFGLVNLEAMAMGKPVVAFAHGALPEIVVDGETGLLVPPHDETALAEATIALLGAAARREVMGRSGRTRVAECFRAQRMAEDVDEVLWEIVAWPATY